MINEEDNESILKYLCKWRRKEGIYKIWYYTLVSYNSEIYCDYESNEKEDKQVVKRKKTAKLANVEKR
jgi:hypothetical protein